MENKKKRKREELRSENFQTTLLSVLDLFENVCEFLIAGDIFDLGYVSTHCNSMLQTFRTSTKPFLSRIETVFVKRFGEKLWTMINENGLALSGSFLLQCLCNRNWRSDLDLWCFDQETRTKSCLYFTQQGGRREHNWRSFPASTTRCEYNLPLEGMDEFVLCPESGKEMVHIQLMAIDPAFSEGCLREKEKEKEIKREEKNRKVICELVQNFDFRFLKNFVLFSNSQKKTLNILDKHSVRHLASAREFSPYSEWRLSEHVCDNVYYESGDDGELSEREGECEKCLAVQIEKTLAPSCFLVSGWSQAKATERLKKIQRRNFTLLHPVPVHIEEGQLRKDVLNPSWIYTDKLVSYAAERFQRTDSFWWDRYLKR